LRKQNQVVSKFAAAHLALAAGVVLACTHAARAQTWTGLSATDSNWNTAANWSALPANNGTASIVFAGLNRNVVTVNVAQDVNSITFNNTSGLFNILGPQGLTVRSGIVNNDTQAQTFTANITVPFNQTWNAFAGPLAFNTVSLGNVLLSIDGAFNTTFAGPITSAGGILVKNGSGVLTLAANNTYSQTLLNAGTIRLAASNTLPDSASLGIGGLGTLDLNGFSDTV